MNEQKIVGGTYFDARTPDVVCHILNDCMETRENIRVFYGDKETGRCWMDEYDTIGRVGRSMGPYKIPLLVKTRRSLGGGALLDHCILRIQKGKRVVYQDSKFNMPEVMVDGCQVLFDGVVYANCSNEGKAQKLAEFLRGERNNKS